MNSESAPNTKLVYIGIFAAMVAAMAAGAANWLDQGFFQYAALGAVYIFGINAVLLLGYELQERASLALRRG